MFLPGFDIDLFLSILCFACIVRIQEAQTTSIICTQVNLMTNEGMTLVIKEIDEMILSQHHTGQE